MRKPASEQKKMKSSVEHSSTKKLVGGINLAEFFKLRRRKELVFGFTGQYGSGISTVVKVLKDYVEKNYEYKINHIKVSKLISKYKNIPSSNLREFERVKMLQEHGNELRKETSNDILAQLAIVETSLFKNEKKDDNELKVLNIIDSIKNEEEVMLFQEMYKDTFYLFGVLCPEEARTKRLVINKDIKESEAVSLIEKDKNEHLDYGQNALGCLQHSDFFILNELNNIGSIKPKIMRCVDLIMNDKTISPTESEYAMYIAQATALTSACISRQVGAVIVSKHGNIISTGRNDVPKFGGGLYCADDGDNDNRCVRRYDSSCKNTDYKSKISSEVLSILVDEFGEEEKIKCSSVVEKISKLDKLKGLTEFSRSIHAEMDAVTTAARTGRAGLRGAKLYCTTFPCHNCARHLVASGVSEVIYIEPYEKSLALKLHDDSIEIDSCCASMKKMQIKPFEGVSPKKFYSLFKSGEIKSGKSVVLHDPKKATPAMAMHKDLVEMYEKLIIANCEDFGLLNASEDS